MSNKTKPIVVDPQYDVGGARNLVFGEIRILTAILNQAITDALNEPLDSDMKYDATAWLCDEDNKLLQLCLFLANMDHDRILAKVAKHGWNLDL